MLLLARTLFWSAGAFALVMAILPQPPAIPGEPSDKVLHMLAFATLAGLSALAYPAVRLRLILAALTGFGALIEVIQAIPSLHRESSWLDWLADVVAAGAVLAIMAAVRILQQRLRMR